MVQYNMTLHHLYNVNEWLSTVCFGCVSHPLSLPFLLIDQSVCTESTVVTRSGYTHMCCLFQCVRFSMCVCNIYIVYIFVHTYLPTHTIILKSCLVTYFNLCLKRKKHTPPPCIILRVAIAILVAKSWASILHQEFPNLARGPEVSDI